MAVERELVVCTANWAAGAPLFRMYIEEVIIDGFKSYASRTVVSGEESSDENANFKLCFLVVVNYLRLHVFSLFLFFLKFDLFDSCAEGRIDVSHRLRLMTLFLLLLPLFVTIARL